MKNEIIIKWTDLTIFMNDLYNEIHNEMKEFEEVESTDAVMYVAGKKAMLDCLG